MRIAGQPKLTHRLARAVAGVAVLGILGTYAQQAVMPRLVG